MKVNRKKSTKRFTFNISRNTTSHKAGANTVTIHGNSDVGKTSYKTPTGTFSPGDSLTMTVNEAKALQIFLNTYLGSNSQS
tara:strand:- start:41 stop:283 length:243 start_codon:yes stop_codon:yes gene_type:complete